MVHTHSASVPLSVSSQHSFFT